MFIQKLLNTKIRGQSTAEYLIILVLVSIGSIGLMSIFGKSVRQQLSNVIASFTGNEDEILSEELKSTAQEAKTRASRAINMKGISKEELKGFGETD